MKSKFTVTCVCWQRRGHSESFSAWARSDICLVFEMADPGYREEECRPVLKEVRSISVADSVHTTPVVHLSDVSVGGAPEASSSCGS